MPNQDAATVEQEGEWRLLAVADGHGARPHHRSDRGARFAVETALALLRATVVHVPRDLLARALPTLAGDLVAGWRERVEADIRTSPLREPPGFPSHAVYGSTCLAAALAPGASLFLQIGDGDILAAAREGGMQRAIPRDPALVGPGTYSLSQPDAAARIHVRLFAHPHPLSAPDFVLLASDGLAKSYRSDDEFMAVARHFRTTLESEPMPGFLAALEPWLAQCSSRGSRDDITAAVFSTGAMATLAGTSARAEAAPA